MPQAPKLTLFRRTNVWQVLAFVVSLATFALVPVIVAQSGSLAAGAWVFLTAAGYGAVGVMVGPDRSRDSERSEV